MRRASALLGLSDLLAVAACHPKPPPSPYPVRACATTLTYAPDAGQAGPFSVAGEWSGFSPSALAPRGDGTFALTLTLDPRDYAYDFVGPDGRAFWDPANPYTRWVGGAEHSRLTVPDCQAPDVRLDAFHASADGALDLAAQYVDGALLAGPDPSQTQLSLDDQVQPGAFDPATGKFALHAAQLGAGKHHVALTAADRGGRTAAPLYLPFWVEPAPFDWRDAVLYFAFTDRFRDGDSSNDAPVSGVQPQANYEGGDYAGIRQAIDEGYFDALGVNALWISPPDQNPDVAFPGSSSQVYTGYHGYWPSAPRAVQRRFGTMADLQAMVGAAHRHGIRVLGDLVVNHVEQDHPYYLAHKDDGWFATSNVCICGASGCDWNLRRLDCWFAPYLPTYDWRDSAMNDQFVSDALWWLETADLDGFRIDAVKQVQDVAIRTIAGRVHEIAQRTGIHYYLVGETFAGATEQPLVAHYIGPTMLDGQFDFPLHWPVMDAFASAGPLTALDQAVTLNAGAYPPGTLNSLFLDNADVARFISYADGTIGSDPSGQAWSNPPPAVVTSPEAYRRATYALAFLFTQPDVPLLYYGDEVGLPGAGDPDNRRLMPWGGLSAAQAALQSTTQLLGNARAKNPGLRRGTRATLAVETDFYLYQRDDPAGRGALIAINRGTTARPFTTSLLGGLAAATGTWTDALGGPPASLAQGVATLNVPAQSAAVYLPP